jgi:alpha-D-ribose 1-methylphosphonate 5-triphosphate diphosphatase
MEFLFQGGTALVQSDNGVSDWREGHLTVLDGRIGAMDAITPRAEEPLTVFDASGLLILPGIIDLHGDAFERQLQPRPAAYFSHDIALADTDRQLVCNGITTAYHGVTYSWEGGLRGRDCAVALIEQIARQRTTAQVDHRLHLRFENHHVHGLQDVIRWVEQGVMGLVSFNDHLANIEAGIEAADKLAMYADRARCPADTFMLRLQAAHACSRLVPQVVETLAATCRLHRIPMASHDDRNAAERERYQALGVTISEFPRSQDALFAAMVLDNRVVMGAPNILLGGSRSGGLTVSDVVKAGMCDILASDYYYPSLLHAPFRLAHDGTCSLAQAWRLVSQNPADAIGLRDRGRIAQGCRADMVLVEPGSGANVRLIATIAAGRLVYCAEPERFVARRPISLAA